MPINFRLSPHDKGAVTHPAVRYSFFVLAQAFAPSSVLASFMAMFFFLTALSKVPSALLPHHSAVGSISPVTAGSLALGIGLVGLLFAVPLQEGDHRVEWGGLSWRTFHLLVAVAWVLLFCAVACPLELLVFQLPVPAIKLLAGSSPFVLLLIWAFFAQPLSDG